MKIRTLLVIAIGLLCSCSQNEDVKTKRIYKGQFMFVEPGQPSYAESLYDVVMDILNQLKDIVNYQQNITEGYDSVPSSVDRKFDIQYTVVDDTGILSLEEKIETHVKIYNSSTIELKFLPGIYEDPGRGFIEIEENGLYGTTLDGTKYILLKLQDYSLTLSHNGNLIKETTIDSSHSNEVSVKNIYPGPINIPIDNNSYSLKYLNQDNINIQLTSERKTYNLVILELSK